MSFFISGSLNSKLVEAFADKIFILQNNLNNV